MAKKLLDTIKFLLRLISCVSICLLVVIVFMQVINRNFFDHSFTWVEEVASMAMVFITYLGAAMATINNGNTRIDFFIRKLPTPVYNAFELLDDVICIVFLVIVSTIAYKQMLTSWSMQTPALRSASGYQLSGHPAGLRADDRLLCGLGHSAPDEADGQGYL